MPTWNTSEKRSVAILDGTRQLRAGHYCPTMQGMKGSEFIKRIQKLARERALACSWHPDMGKGSHGVLNLGNARTIVRDPKDEP